MVILISDLNLSSSPERRDADSKQVFSYFKQFRQAGEDKIMQQKTACTLLSSINFSFASSLEIVQAV